MRLEGAYREKEDLIMVGAYQAGSDPMVDAAVASRGSMLGFLRQDSGDSTPMSDTRALLGGLAGEIEQSARRRG
jgi:flagellum-specific ATP synthase